MFDDYHYYKDDESYSIERAEKDKEIRSWQKAGFEHVPTSQGCWEALECPHCGAMVVRKRWRLHLKSLHKNG